MNDPKRYRCWVIEYGLVHFEPHGEGDWVKFTEVSALLIAQAAQVEQLQNENDAWKAAVQRVRDSFTHRDDQGRCGCIYCTRDIEGLNNACAEYEMKRYFETSKLETQLAAQAAQVETVRQFVEAWREEADTEAKDRGPAWVGAEAALRRCADELEHVFARVASLEAGAAPTGSSAEVQSGAVTAAERTEQGTICPVCKEPALQSWSRVDSDDCGVLCIACGAEFAPARNEEEPLAAAPR